MDLSNPRHNSDLKYVPHPDTPQTDKTIPGVRVLGNDVAKDKAKVSMREGY